MGDGGEEMWEEVVEAPQMITSPGLRTSANEICSGLGVRTKQELN